MTAASRTHLAWPSAALARRSACGRELTGAAPIVVDHKVTASLLMLEAERAGPDLCASCLRARRSRAWWTFNVPAWAIEGFHYEAAAAEVR